MKQEEMFLGAKWICVEECNEADKYQSGVFIRRHFETRRGESARIKLIGLGTFEVYVNGRRVSDEYFLPLNSEYENCGEPKDEELSYRIYATEYDLSDYVNEGDNLLAVHLGCGWYTGPYISKKYGDKKLIYMLTVSGTDERVIL